MSSSFEPPAAAVLPPPPDVRSPAALLALAAPVLAFCASLRACRAPHKLLLAAPPPPDAACSPRPDGTFCHSLLRDGAPGPDAALGHVVSATRLVIQFSWAAQRYARAPAWLALARAAARDAAARFATPRGPRWTAHAAEPARGDAAVRAYGCAFALLAAASLLAAADAAGDAAAAAAARADLARATADLDSNFWESAADLYADEIDARGARTAYRGANANMHAFEAHLAAWDATREPFHLERARAIARAMCRRQAAAVAAAVGGARPRVQCGKPKGRLPAVGLPSVRRPCARNPHLLEIYRTNAL